MTILSPQLAWYRKNTGQLSTFLATDYIDLLPRGLSCNDSGPHEGPPPAICVETQHASLSAL